MLWTNNGASEADGMRVSTVEKPQRQTAEGGLAGGYEASPVDCCSSHPPPPPAFSEPSQRAVRSGA